MVLTRYQVQRAIASIFSLLLSCARGSGADEVARSYLRAEYSGKRPEAYGYVSADDRSVKSLTAYTGSSGIAQGIGQLLGGQVSVAVDSVTERRDSAVVIATVTHPDMEAVVGDLLGLAFASAVAGDTAQMRQKMVEAIQKKYEGKPLPTTTAIDTVELVRDPEGWRVVRHWRSEMLRVRADSLSEQKRFREALATYDSALALAPKDARAKDRRDRAFRAIAMEEAKDQYIHEHLVLEHFRTGTGSHFGEEVPGVFGTIRNRGDSTLTRVEITVYFLGPDGKAIGETQFSPVLVTEFSISDNTPLKPGYVRDFGYSVKDYAPTSWGRKARAEITRIEFQSEHRKP